ncbi:MAG: metallophosphoesterase [Propionibacteriaceae bacterium]|nr:metallophosphoesterase [Propionibacteriaceae bacterium]
MSENDANSWSIGRRSLLAGGTAAAAAGVLASLPTSAHAGPKSSPSRQMPLSFGRDGKFKIVQFNDTQDGALTDRRTVELISKVLDQEKPQFAVINGDVINGSPRNDREVKQAYNNVVMPMESRGIKWALTFGNHDEDSTESNGTSMREPQIVNFLRQYKHNLNPGIDADGGVFGESNAHLLVRGSRGHAPAFAIWLLDSNRYAPQTIAGQDRQGLMGYDWIRPEQIRWYQDVSMETEKRYRRKVPGLMYFHIPLFEHHHMWFGSQFSSDEAGVARARERHQIEGVKHEGVYTGLFNSGLYAAAFERGDIKGMYCGHDHINTYKGNYYGIELGYGPGTGFGTYGLNDGTWDMHTLRGARVFELDERAEGVYTGTRLVFAKDLGIDMNPAPQKMERATDFPRYVRA